MFKKDYTNSTKYFSQVKTMCTQCPSIIIIQQISMIKQTSKQDMVKTIVVTFEGSLPQVSSDAIK